MTTTFPYMSDLQTFLLLPDLTHPITETLISFVRIRTSIFGLDAISLRVFLWVCFLISSVYHYLLWAVFEYPLLLYQAGLFLFNGLIGGGHLESYRFFFVRRSFRVIYLFLIINSFITFHHSRFTLRRVFSEGR